MSLLVNTNSSIHEKLAKIPVDHSIFRKILSKKVTAVKQILLNVNSKAIDLLKWLSVLEKGTVKAFIWK